MTEEELLLFGERSFRAGARWLAKELDDALPSHIRAEVKRLIGDKVSE